eukprot:c30010_g1_i1 orf=226-471(-)
MPCALLCNDPTFFSILTYYQYPNLHFLSMTLLFIHFISLFLTGISSHAMSYFCPQAKKKSFQKLFLAFVGVFSIPKPCKRA